MAESLAEKKAALTVDLKAGRMVESKADQMVAW